MLGSRLHSLRYTKSLMQFPKLTQTDDLFQSHAWYSTSKPNSLNQTCDRVEWSRFGPLVSLIFYFTRVCSPSWSEGRPSIPIWIYDDEQCWASICAYLPRLKYHGFNQNTCFWGWFVAFFFFFFLMTCLADVASQSV